MDLEHIVRLIASFGTGIVVGVTADRQFSYSMDLLEIMSQDTKQHHETQGIEKLNYLSNTKKSLEFIVLLASGIVNGLGSWSSHQPFSTVTIDSLSGFVATYSGIKIGELASRFVRYRRRLSPEQERLIDGYAERLKLTIINGNEEDVTRVFDECNKYIQKILVRNKNPKTAVNLRQRFRQLIDYGFQYMAVRRYLEFESPKQDFQPTAMVLNEEKNDTSYALVLHNGNLHVMQCKRQFEQHVTGQEGIDVGFESGFSMTTLQVGWDGTIDSIFSIASGYGKSPVLLVADYPIPFQDKKIIASQFLAGLYISQKQQEFKSRHRFN